MTPQRPWIEAQILMERDGMTQTRLAKQIGISISYLNDIIRGRKRPNGRIIGLVAKELKVPFSMLVPATETEDAA